MVDERYLSFDETMKALGIGEDELLNLVAANEIRAFRIDREMKFKETDVQAMGGTGGDDIVSIEDAGVVMVDVPEDLELEEVAEAIPEAEEELVLLEDAGETITLEDDDGGTVLMEDGVLDLEAEGSTEMALNATGSEGLGTEEIVFEDEDLSIGTLDDSDIGTQEITVQEEAIGDDDITVAVDDIDATVQEDSVGAAVGRGSARGAAISSRSSAKMSARRRQIAVSKVHGNPIMAVFLVITFMVMLYPLGLFATIIFQGFTTRPSATPPGSWANPGTEDGLVPEMGLMYQHSNFRWTRQTMVAGDITKARDPENNELRFDYLNPQEEWWGRPERGVKDGEFDPNSYPGVPAKAVEPQPEPEKKEGEEVEGGGEEKKEGEEPKEGEESEKANE